MRLCRCHKYAYLHHLNVIMQWQLKVLQAICSLVDAKSFNLDSDSLAKVPCTSLSFE